MNFILPTYNLEAQIFLEFIDFPKIYKTKEFNNPQDFVQKKVIFSTQ